METSICPQCKNPVQPGWAYCDNCGNQLQPAIAEQQPPGGKICPQCGYTNPLPATFCGSCGEAFKSNPARVNTPAYIPTPNLAPYSEAEQLVVNLTAGRLVIQNDNVSIPIPQDVPEAILGRQDAASNSYPEIDLNPYGGHTAGVGRQHARLVMDRGHLCLIDLDSVNGSYVNRKKIPPDQPVPIQDGDEIRLGRLKMIYQAG
jgi:ribosomal protein L40E